MDREETGRSGERLAADFLRKNGYTVVKRNYHTRFGEIDIIAENAAYIVFTEVKTRRVGGMVSPAEAVDARKRRRILLTAEDFLTKYETPLQPRFDVAEVTVYEKADGSPGYKLHYIRNAF